MDHYCGWFCSTNRQFCVTETIHNFPKHFKQVIAPFEIQHCTQYMIQRIY